MVVFREDEHFREAETRQTGDGCENGPYSGGGSLIARGPAIRDLEEEHCGRPGLIFPQAQLIWKGSAT